MYYLPRLCLTILLSLFLLGSQVIAGPLEALPVQTKAPSKQLYKRGTLQDLYATVKDSDKVKTGTAVSWQLYPEHGKTAAVYAPSEFYGCTLVVVANGNGIMIGHFAQEKPGNVVCMQDDASVKSMISKLEDAEGLVDIDNVDGNRAWIIYSDDTDQTSPGYKAIFSNLNDKNRLNIPSGQITPLSYRRGGGGGDSDKLVVQWQPNDKGATLNVYIRSDNAAFTGTYDLCGNIVKGGSRRLMGRGEGPVCVSVVPIPAPTCTYVAPQPPVINAAFCSCSGKSYSLTSIPGTPVPESSSCAYTKMPTATVSGLDSDPATTDSAACQVCTPYAENGSDCTSIPNCTPAPTA